MKTVKIFNIPQADTFVQHGCKVVRIDLETNPKLQSSLNEMINLKRC